MTANEIKSTALEAGADICGIASIDRFSSAPKGFHPNDIYGDCRSVLVFAKKLPVGSLFASSCIPYTFINRVITEEVDGLALTLSRKLGDRAVKNVPIHSCPQSALDGTTVNQQACRLLSNYRNERGFVLKKCWVCRKVCPSHSGIMSAKE